MSSSVNTVNVNNVQTTQPPASTDPKVLGTEMLVELHDIVQTLEKFDPTVIAGKLMKHGVPADKVQGMAQRIALDHTENSYFTSLLSTQINAFRNTAYELKTGLQSGEIQPSKGVDALVALTHEVNTALENFTATLPGGSSPTSIISVIDSGDPKEMEQFLQAVVDQNPHEMNGVLQQLAQVDNEFKKFFGIDDTSSTKDTNASDVNVGEKPTPLFDAAESSSLIDIGSDSAGLIDIGEEPSSLIDV